MPDASQQFRRVALSVFLIATTILSFAKDVVPVPHTPDPGWSALVREHLSRHPAAQAQDLYKLLFQGTMGAEHAALEPAAAEQYLAQEMDGLQPAESEPLTEPLDPDGRLVRLNLRPYKARGGTAAALARAFLQTAREVHPDRPALGRVFGSIDPSVLGATAGPLAQLAAEMERAGYPAVSHSEPYRRLYRPAYRVILSSLVPALLPAAQTPAP